MRTAVMLTKPIRGSLSSRVMMDLISSRTCSPAWSARSRVITTSVSKSSKPCLDFFPLESVRLHRVAGLKVLPAFEADAALLACRHLPHVFLEVLERGDPALEDLLLPTEKLDPASTADLALQHAASGDDAKPRDLDRGDDLDLALADLTVGGFAQALGRALHVLGQLVDDVVVTYLDLRALCRRGACRGRLQVEAHDDRVRDAGQKKVRVADCADALADDLDRDHRVLDLLQRREQGFERALRVRLDDEAELFDLAFLGASGELFKGDARRDVPCRFHSAALDELGQRDLARRSFRCDDLEDVARLGHLAHA